MFPRGRPDGSSDAMCRAASGLAEYGYEVFPCHPRGKRPLTPNGFKDATRDERTILHWYDRAPDANVAVACGASGISVLDIDTKAGADPREVISDLDLDGQAITWTGTAPECSEEYPDSLSGERGAQVFFTGTRKTCRTSVPGVELRGAGGYVVVPPSVHPSGVPYLGDLPPVSALPKIPASVNAILGTPPGTNVRTPPEAWLSILRDGIPAGERHTQLTRLCGHLIRQDIDLYVVAELLHLVNSHRCRPPLDASELGRIVEDIARAETLRRKEQRERNVG